MLFFRQEVKYLGHIIKPEYLEVDGDKTASLHDENSPSFKTDLLSFFSLCKIYSWFTVYLTNRDLLIYNLLKKGEHDYLPAVADVSLNL